MTAATLAPGNAWPAATPAAAGRAPVTLAQCVLLALLLHLWALLVLGSVPGGSAPPGAGQGGTLNITLRGPVDPGLRSPPPAQPLPAHTGPAGSAAAPRWGGAVREAAPAADSPGATRQGFWQPQPGRDLQGPMPATSRVRPVQDEAAEPARPPEREPARAAAPVPEPSPAPVAAPPADPAPSPVAEPPRLRALADLPARAALPAPALASPLMPLSPPQMPVPAPPGNALAPVPLAEPPPPAVSQLPQALPPAAAPLSPLTSPPPLPAPTVDSPAAPLPPMQPALPVPPMLSPTDPTGLDGLPQAPAPGAPDAGAQVGRDVATPPAAAASAPRLNLELARPRGGELSRLPSPGLLAVMPRPPEARTALERDLEQAARPDCRNAHGNKGLLAVVPLVVDTVRGTGCRW